MQSIKDFYEALAQDAAMQERAKLSRGEQPMEEAEELSAITAFAGKEGYVFTADSLKAYLAEEFPAPLTDEALAEISGGAFDEQGFPPKVPDELLKAAISANRDGRPDKCIKPCPQCHSDQYNYYRRDPRTIWIPFVSLGEPDSKCYRCGRTYNG